MSFQNEFPHRARGGLGVVRRLALGALVAAALVTAASEVIAQQLPGITPQQLEQLQQARGSNATTNSQSLVPQETILQPTMPPQTNLPPSRLEEIMSQRAGVRLRLIGYDQLGSGRAVNLPQVGAIQDSYVLGPGDEIVVSLRGQENAEYRVVVDRDGRVVLPRLNPVSAAGRTFGQFRQDLTDAIHRAYVSTEGFVSVGRLRQISVLVSGEVGSPGVRTLTGLSTPVDAILVSGGIKKTGSLRNLRIIRGGREIPVDLYGVITGQARGNTTALADGDRLVVPPLGRTVAAVGWVRRPGIYELAGSSISVRELINLAGGLEVRGKYRTSLLRVSSDGRNQLEALPNGTGTAGDSDILFVQPAASETTSMATLSGGTALAGKYAAASKLSDLLKSPGALGEDPYTLFGIISRKDPQTLLRVLVPFTPVAVLKGTEDLAIQSDDIVRVISTNEARVLFSSVQQYRVRTVNSREALINPLSNQSETPNSAMSSSPQGSQPNAAGGGTDIAAMLANANRGNNSGQLDRKALSDVNSQLDNQNDPEFGGNQNPNSYGPQNQYPNQYANQYPNQNSNQYPNLYPNQYQYGNQYPNQYPNQYGNQYSNQYPNQYPNQYQSPFGPNQEQSATATAAREVTRINDLAKQLRVDPLVLVNFLNDRAVNVDGAVNGPGLYLVGPDADIQSLLAAAGGTARWADKSSVEIISTSVDSSTGRSRTERRNLSMADASGASYIVSPRDEVRINEVFTAVGIGSVTIQGQVRHAGTYQITRGEHLSDLLSRAGGLTEVAYPYGAVFLRRSAAQREADSYRRQAQEIENQLMLAMSSRDPNTKLSPDAFQAMQGYVQQIRNQTPLGRISVVADPVVLASNPAVDPLLEPNDVLYIPQRPDAVAVLGEVLQPSSVPYDRKMSARDYIDRAGGYSQFADESETILVLPDGSARRVEQSWLNFDSETVPPGSTVFVARDVSGVNLHQIILETTSIVSQLAVTAASLAVLAKQ